MPSTYSENPTRSPLVWDPSWYHRSESIYGLACKLSTANSLRIEEALEYFSRGRCVQLLPAYRNWRRDFDGDDFFKKLGCPIGLFRARYESFPDWFYQVSNGDLDDFYFRSLRYCPICLQQCFHSISHQCRLVRHCPVHAQDLIELCPHCHELINPYFGRPWHCTACNRPLVDIRGFQWMRIFAAFPDCDSTGAWQQADQLQWDTRRDVDSLEATVRTFFGRVSEDAIIPVFSSAPFVPDHDYWRRNIRKLGLWYFQELQSLMRGVFERHLYCTLAPFVPNRLTNVPGNCLVAQALWDCASLIWGTGAALDWPTMNRRALSKLEQHLVHRIFDRKKAAYLGDEAAELVVRATALMFFASALERRLKEKSERFYLFREKDAAGLWSAAGVAWEMKEGRFRISTSLVRDLMVRINGLGGANCSYPDELRYSEYDPQPAYRERQNSVQEPPR